MGNLLEGLLQHRNELILGTGLAAVVWHLIQDLSYKREFRKKLLELQVSLGQSSLVGSRNQLYLKEAPAGQASREDSQFPIYKIAITGGPCAGKSTSLERIRKDLMQKGFRVLSVSEIPTLVVQGGGMILMSRFTMQERIKFQSLLIKFQMYAEDYFTKLAALSKSPSIVLCDRGTVDPGAYVSTEQFQAIMDQVGVSLVTLRDRRYDRVIFLRSAANGAQKFYTLANNVARSEGIEEARNLDRKTLDVWTGHPHLTICPNVQGETFDDKIARAISAVRHTVGLQEKPNFEEKYLIEKPIFPPQIKTETSDIEEIFLVNEDERYSEDKIKKRGQFNIFSYQRKYRGIPDANNHYKQSIRKPLTSLQYVMLREQRADARYAPVNRKRIDLAYNSLSYSIDVYQSIAGHEGAVYLLRFVNEGGDGRERIPPFINFIRDVRKEDAYRLRHIAKRKEEPQLERP